jgi:hypothetical protein
MLGDVNPMRWGNRASTAAVLSLALLASGCGGSFFGGPATTASAPAAAPAAAAPAASAAPGSSGGHWLRDDLSDFFSTSSDTGPQSVAGASPDVECPYIKIREGASTLIIRGPGDNPAMSLKYEGTFVRAARQCSLVAGQMVIRLGVEGRIVLGPQGTPGEVTVPLRIAVVDQTPSATKTVWTKLILIPVTVQSIDSNPTFTHIADDVSFPMPSSAALDNYIIYIGFDPIGAQALEKHERPRRVIRHRPRRRPAPTG